ncbi:MAG: Zn-dependent hydrolase [Streptosporangiaceae bacterium]|nr:Zn-dependent hydrolase [Streptosporangiaceae bacterium]
MSGLVEINHPGETDWASTHPRKSWFDVRPLAAGVFLIAEPGHVNNFLVVGEDRAVLLDTGLGVADIRAVAEGLAGKPLSVVNSHYHFDHSGGNRHFDEIAIHRAGAELLAEPAPDGLAESYMAYTQRLIEAWQGYKDLDDTYFHLVTADTLIRPLPEGFDPADYRIVPTTATTLLDDGDEIDLGGRVLQVMHTPGHSPDSICLFDERNGLLFGGDTINTGPIYAQLEDSDVEAFARSTRRLAGLGDVVARVFVCHFMRVDNAPGLLAEIADGFERLLDGSAAFRDNADCLGYPVREACFDHFSVFVPGENGGTRV